MTDNGNHDSHKLIYHPERVTDWLQGRDIYPIYVEIGPSSRCNFRCCFCALDYTGYKGDFIPRQILLDALDDMAAGGVKSVMFAGAGESLLHPDISLFINHAADCGIDVAVTTNGALLGEKLAGDILPRLSWIRISINGGSPGVYASVHGCAEMVYEQVISNLKACVQLKKRQKLTVTIGTQCLILGENAASIYDLALRLKEIGVDYFSLKPFSKHPQSINEGLQDPWPDLGEDFYRSIAALATKDFGVGVRRCAMDAVMEAEKPYEQCLGLPFFACLEASGDIYPCHSFMGLEKYSYGNVRESTFREIWHGEKRKKIVAALEKMIDSKCRKACRLDQINRYLWQLRHKPPHANFI